MITYDYLPIVAEFVCDAYLCVMHSCVMPDHQPTATLVRICREYHERIVRLENEKYDLEYDAHTRDLIVSEHVMPSFVMPSFVTPSFITSSFITSSLRFTCERRSTFRREQLRELNNRVNVMRGKL